MLNKGKKYISVCYKITLIKNEMYEMFKIYFFNNIFANGKISKFSSICFQTNHDELKYYFFAKIINHNKKLQNFHKNNKFEIKRFMLSKKIDNNKK